MRHASHGQIVRRPGTGYAHDCGAGGSRQRHAASSQSGYRFTEGRRKVNYGAGAWPSDWVCLGHCLFDSYRRRLLIDRVNLARGEAAIAGTRAAQRLVDRINNCVVIDQIQPDRAAAGAGVDGHRPGAAGAGNVGNRRRRDAGGR